MLIKVHTKRIHLDVIRQSRVNKEADLKKSNQLMDVVGAVVV